MGKKGECEEVVGEFVVDCDCDCVVECDCEWDCECEAECVGEVGEERPVEVISAPLSSHCRKKDKRASKQHPTG